MKIKPKIEAGKEKGNMKDKKKKAKKINRKET
jgi:hypothetical protein